MLVDAASGYLARLLVGPLKSQPAFGGARPLISPRAAATQPGGSRVWAVRSCVRTGYYSCTEG